MPRGYPTRVTLSIPIGGGRVTARKRSYHNLQQTVSESISQEGDQFGRDIIRVIPQGPSPSTPGQAGWPIKSGRSFAAFSARVTTAGRTVMVEILNRYLYARFVEHGTRFITPRRIIAGVWRRNRRQILRDYEREVTRRIQRRVDRAGRRAR